jgi:hypothetical protein
MITVLIAAVVGVFAGLAVGFGLGYRRGYGVATLEALGAVFGRLAARDIVEKGPPT